MESKATPKDLLVMLREDIKQQLIDIRNQDTAVLTGETIAELTLAKRHLEDARMRLGVALAIVEGKDPLGAR